MNKAQDISKKLDKISPNKYAYDGDKNSFVYGNPEKKVDKIGICWRPTVKILKKCQHEEIDMLVVHEPLIQKKKIFLYDEKQLDFFPNKQRERLLREIGLIVYRIHSSWDDAPGGSNDSLAETLELKVDEKLKYGRIGKIQPCDLKDFCKHVKVKLGSDYCLVVGKLNSTVSKIATVAGSGNDTLDLMEIANQRGADVYVSGDIRDSSARYANELGLTLVDVGGYYTEKPGTIKLHKILSDEFGKQNVIYFDTYPAWTII